MQTVKFYTLGCKVNQYDTQSIRERFIQAGFKELENSKPADVCIINTCTVTHKADAGSLNVIRKAKRENPKAKIIITGCLTELDEGKIRKQVDKSLIIKNKDKENILEYLFLQDGITGKRNNGTTDSGISYFKAHTRAFLKIQDGCNNSCSYCKVPYVRGPARSRPPDEIIPEAGRLLKNGFKELVLCGICLGSYGKDLSGKTTLVNVIEALQNLPGLFRIRLSSIEAQDISDELLEKMTQSKKLCRHLHIPMQSGDDEILKKMNRNYSCLDYLNLIKKIRSRIPQIAITTDVLAGFPTETEANFQNTVQLIKGILPLKVHIFPYSRRAGTQAAAKFEQNVDPKVIKERSGYLQKVAFACSLSYKKQFLNKSLLVLVEGKSKLRPGFWEGYTDNYLKVLFESNRKLKNIFVLVKLKEITNNYLLADLAGEDFRLT
jgi:threonylcarbamoyladenosine tRNA methylthiotransferase MtaB